MTLDADNPWVTGQNECDRLGQEDLFETWIALIFAHFHLLTLNTMRV